MVARIVLLLLCLSLSLRFGRSHIYFECPPARTCFYGGGENTDGDGPWRQEPCDRAPITPTVTVAAGDQMCITLNEFVPHEGFFEINLADKPVGPGDSEPTWIPLISRIDQTTDGRTTAIQAFNITIPSDFLAEHATIQVRQYAKEYDWFYYACTDVKVVNGSIDSIPSDSNTCYEKAECELTDGPARMRIKILENVVYGSVVLVFVIAFLVWMICVCKHGTSIVEDNENQIAKIDDLNGKWKTFKVNALKKPFKTYLIILAVSFVVVLLAVVLPILELLKSCTIDN